MQNRKYLPAFTAGFFKSLPRVVLKLVQGDRLLLMVILWETIKAIKLKLESIVDCILTTNKAQPFGQPGTFIKSVFEQNGNGGASL